MWCCHGAHYSTLPERSRWWCMDNVFLHFFVSLFICFHSYLSICIWSEIKYAIYLFQEIMASSLPYHLAYCLPGSVSYGWNSSSDNVTRWLTYPLTIPCSWSRKILEVETGISKVNTLCTLFNRSWGPYPSPASDHLHCGYLGASLSGHRTPLKRWCLGNPACQCKGMHVHACQNAIYCEQGVHFQHKWIWWGSRQSTDQSVLFWLWKELRQT